MDCDACVAVGYGGKACIDCMAARSRFGGKQIFGEQLHRLSIDIVKQVGLPDAISSFYQDVFPVLGNAFDFKVSSQAICRSL